MAKCTIVTGTYNKPKLLVECAKSVVQQTVADWEWVVVLDGPTQETFDVAVKLKEQIGSRMKLNLCTTPAEYRTLHYRPAEITNLEFGRAEGEYVAWLSDDDLLKPTFLEKLCIGDARYCAVERVVSWDGAWRWHCNNPTRGRLTADTFAEFTDGGAMVMKSSIFREMPWRLPTDWINASRVDQLFLRAVAAHCGIDEVPEILLTHRASPLSTHQKGT